MIRQINCLVDSVARRTEEQVKLDHFKTKRDSVGFLLTDEIDTKIKCKGRKRERERERERQRERQRGRQRETKTERETVGETERDRDREREINSLLIKLVHVLL